jgi:hypothetical protein
MKNKNRYLVSSEGKEEGRGEVNLKRYGINS